MLNWNKFFGVSLKSVLVYTIVFQIGFGSTILSQASHASFTGFGAGSGSSKGRLAKLTLEDFARPFIAQRIAEDPVFAEFVQSPDLPAPQYSANDPAIDLDPFFLRSQSWGVSRSVQSDEAELSFSKDAQGGLTLEIPAIKKSLKLRAPLTPVYSNDEYVFLTADEGSDLFAKASGTTASGEAPGEGLFFINYSELLAHSAVNRPVHVHFFPLPGAGWTGAINAEEAPQIESLIITSRDGTLLPLDFNDVEKVQQVQLLNSFMGSLIAMRASGADIGAKFGAEGFQELQRISQLSPKNSTAAANAFVQLASRLPQVLPARGSTYGFGMLFTGIDLDHPENSIWKPEGGKSSFLKYFSSISAELNPFAIRNAYADDVYAALIHKMITFGWTFGGIVAASVGLKYTVLKHRFEERRGIEALRKIKTLEFNIPLVQKLVKAGVVSAGALSEFDLAELVQLSGFTEGQAKELKAAAAETAVQMKAERPTIQSPLMRKILPQSAQDAIIRVAQSRAMRETKEIGDVLAHSLTFVSQLSGVVTANAIERLADRYIPQAAASENKLLRKALNVTFLWSRKVSTNTPVSMKTFMLGAVVMGTVDTAIVAFQDIWMIPEMCKAVAPHLPPALEERVYKAFDPENPNTRSLVVNDVVRNYIAWMTVGASSYSQDSQAQQESVLRQQVDQALRRMGKNPLAPEVQGERDRLFNEAMNTKLRQLGLPDQIEFLFDVSTLDAKVLEALGYRVSAKDREKVNGANVSANSRPGLVKSSLLLSIKEARKQLKASPTEGNRKVLELLEKVRREMSIYSLNPTDPVASWKRIRQNRSTLALLTYTGDVDAAVKYVPELWSEFDPEAAKAAATLFRKSYYSYLTGDGTLIELPEQFVKQNVNDATQKATKELSAEYGIDPASVRAEHELEFAVRVEQKLRDRFVAERKAKEVEDYRHPALSWFEKKQQQRAIRIANERLVSDPAFADLSQEEMQKRHRQYFSEALAKVVGLHLDPTDQPTKELIEYAQRTSEENTQQEIERNDGLKHYLERLEAEDSTLGVESPQEEAARIRFWLQAVNFIESYRSGAIDQELVAPRSVGQPGITQGIRQWDSVRGSKTATLLARLADSAFSDEMGYRPGLVAKIDRTVPGAYDLRTSVMRMTKSFTSAVTVKYQFNRYFWDVKIPFSAMLIGASASFLISAPSQWLNRLMRQQGWKPMDGVMSKVAYGIPYAFVTFGASIPFLLFAADAAAGWSALTHMLSSSEAYRLMSGAVDGSLPYLPAVLLIPLLNEVKHRLMTKNALKQAEKPVDARESSTSAKGKAKTRTQAQEISPELQLLLQCEGAFL